MKDAPKLIPLAYSVAPLVEALNEYDRTAQERQRQWDTVRTEKEVSQAELADGIALQKVQDAFYEVTKDRNSRDNCRRCGLPFMRKVARMSTI
jgi:hypothetical protein